MRTFIIVCGATIAMTAGYAHALASANKPIQHACWLQAI